MSDATRFITSLGQAIAAMALYNGAHPARARAVDVAYHRLQALLHTDSAPQFSFVDQEVVYGGRTMRDLREWTPAGRLTRAGIQRMEFSPAVSRDDFEHFVDELARRLAGPGTSDAPQTRQSTVRYGALGLRGEAHVTPLAAPLPTATIRYSLSEEIAATQWIHEEVVGGNTIPLLEAEATVRSLAAAMHAGQQVVIPLLSLREYDEYTTTHSLNVSVLAMALAESLGLGGREVRAFGVAGLLHDIGKVCIPHDVLNKPGQLTPAERDVIRRHPVDGARLILQSGQQLDVAAAVAYEHHIMIDGCGYPTLHFRRDCHPASHVVHVCDVYDALRTTRPYRAAWEHEQVMAYLRENAGTEFDPALVRTFDAMMREWRREVAA
jgi:putative nucleotidyltransferase with HDIG domain